MLQIKTIATMFGAALLCFGAVVQAEERTTDWLLKDAYEEEYVPLSATAVTMPQDVRDALDSYHRGDFRKTVETLEKLRALKLPDGHLDFITFVLAESYRQLGCADLAIRDYNYVVNKFPSGDNAPASCYRLIEYAVRNNEYEKADSVSGIFLAKYQGNPLVNAVYYLCGLVNYKRRDYDKVVQLLARIPPESSRYVQSRFLLVYCYIQGKDFSKALIFLERIRTDAGKTEMGHEAALTIGDIYAMQNNPGSALKYYLMVPPDAARYQYAQIKTARALFDLGRFAEAAKIARDFIDKDRGSQYFFEMASMLEQADSKLGKERDALQAGKMIRGQIVNARLAFEIFDEVDQVTNMLRSWQGIQHDAVKNGKKSLQNEAETSIAGLQDLEKRYYALLKEVSPEGLNGDRTIPYQAERRYMGMLKENMVHYDDTLAEVNKAVDNVVLAMKKSPEDTVLALKMDNITRVADTLKLRREKFSHEYDVVVKECIGRDYANREVDEELQAKFVDWAFMKYQDKKEQLKKINLQIASRKKQAKKIGEQKPDTNAVAAPVQQAKGEKPLTENDRDLLMQSMAEDRVRLAGHIKTVLEVYPKSKYNPQCLLRLAELYFDAAGDEFEKDLKAYEKKMAQGADSAGLEFPEYKLDSVIMVYDDIITTYPGGDNTDVAYYYKALALQKLGKDDAANKILLTLIDKFPQSDYFVEANMNIGKYYFDHPKTENGQGYKLAEDAYRRVLYFREHPQYISALYHLGWCYYMQDRYDEAISVFKNLIEDSHLEFDPSKTDEKQMANPLLRGEAIDYIAISFDAENKINEAIEFLKLVGNVDYAALVLKRIGELREEDLDYKTAIGVYRRLLAEYPGSRETPATYVSLIRLYESNNKSDSAMLLRQEFFTKYTKGGEWQSAVTKAAKKDTAFMKTIDSMAISNGLYVADLTYRHADSTKNHDDYAKAAKSYQLLVESYPGEQRSAEALWNLAVILDTKLQDKPQAFDRYTAFSKLTVMDPARREQSALNAIALAQSLLPPDSMVQKGVLDFAATKVVEAVGNYCVLFPQGASWGKIMLTLGAVYFNRQLFSNASKVYEQVAGKTGGGQAAAERFEALSFLGQCYFGQEDWPASIGAFTKIWKESKDSAQQAAAYKLLLQSEFLNAKKYLAAGDFANAAELFRTIDEKYRGSEYGDVVLFNSAEALEKIQQLDKACDRYADLVKRYPASKLAPDALFNAAENFEKINKFDKAAECYENIAANYPYSEKAKDALFNVGFCYEKLNKLDKMADANERYSARYPGEKDVEAMLLRSGSFYAKAKMWDRAVSVYRNFIRRYPRSPKAIEAYYMVAKCEYDQNDMENALLGFTQTEQQNLEQAKNNLETNNYFAGEASYYIGIMKRDQFLAVKLTLPDEQMKKSIKLKSDLLGEAVKAFQRVMQYRSERMFEAAYRVGQLYEDLSLAYNDQERPSLDPIKAAVLNKEIETLASALLQKSFIPYEKVIDMAKGFDSLGAEQKPWVEKSLSSLKKNFVDAGDLLSEAVTSMSGAPVPKEIREKPLYYYQYLKQLTEAVIPLKDQVRDYFASLLPQCDSLKLTGDEVAAIRTKFVFANYSIGEGYDHLALDIQKNSKEVSKDLSQDQKEDLIFQLEDIVYEVQDKAIFAYEDGLKRIKKFNLDADPWAGKIMEGLARLSPDKYGAAFYHRVGMVSDGSWIVRPDSVDGWNSLKIPSDGWKRASVCAVQQPLVLGAGKPDFIWSTDADSPRGLVWKDLFLNGAPRNAAIYIATPGMYRLFLNGTLVLSDTVGNRSPQKIDSASGIAKLLKGGDNAIAVDVRMVEPNNVGVAIAVTALIDTNEHFASSVTMPKDLPPVAMMPHEMKEQPSPVTQSPSNSSQPTTPEKGASTVTNGQQTPPVTPKQPSYITKYRNEGELLMAIETYQNREVKLDKEIKKEQDSIKDLKIDNDDIDGKLKSVKEQIEQMKSSISSMSKGKGPAPAPKAAADSVKATPPVKSPVPEGGKPADTAAKSAGPASGNTVPVKNDSSIKAPDTIAKPVLPAVDSAKVKPADSARNVPPTDTNSRKPGNSGSGGRNSF
jgi:tetratricopeptide (TPR) repeat protein